MPESDAVQCDSKGPLGQKVDAPEQYAPEVLFPVPRAQGRDLLGLVGALPFTGDDIWNAYEVSFLDAKGVPRRDILELTVPCTSPNIVESKSLKLYLNSLNFVRFASTSELVDTISKDVGGVVGSPVAIALCGMNITTSSPLEGALWHCIDDENVGEVPSEIMDTPDDEHLTIRQADPRRQESFFVTERLVSHVLRTCCPVTGQPDWGSVLVEYRGVPIDHSGLMRYIISLRREVGFHENAVERIALAIFKRCTPQVLRVTGRFLRRGGIDINPMRSIGEDVEGILGAPFPQMRVPGQ